MTSSSLHRKIVVFLLAAVLTAPWALAGEPRAALSERDGAGVLRGSPLDLLSGLWRAVTVLWAESGCTIDPYGGCAAGRQDDGAADAAGDSGCTIDPDGGCRD
jgi:hypothetical protein